MSTLPKRHRWTREQYERVVRLGGFEPDQRLELIDGESWIGRLRTKRTRWSSASCTTPCAVRTEMTMSSASSLP